MASLRNCWIVLFLLTLVLSPSKLAAQGPLIFPNGAVNGASFRPPDFPGGAVAPGSLVSIFGQGLGLREPVVAGGFPLPTQLGPLQTRVRINDTADCPLFFISEGQINCQLPDDLAGTQIRLRVINSAGPSNEITVPLGPFGFGFFTRNGNGRGLMVGSNFTDDPDPARRFQLHGPETPARPGQVLLLWGTGLGATLPRIPAGQPSPSSAAAVIQPQVFIGDRPAQVQYAGRAPGFAGLDQIQAVIPPDAPAGCAVPVRIQLGNQISNTGTIAINPGGLRCVDPFEDILAGTSHGSIVLHSGLGRLGSGQLGPGPMMGGPGPGHGGPGGGSGTGGVGRGGIGPIGLHPGLHLHTGGLGTMASVGPDVVSARFVRLASSSNLDIGIPPAPSNSCQSYPLGAFANADLFAGPVQLLSAGILTLNGPATQLTLSPEPVGSGGLYVAALPSPLAPGTYTVSGSGGAEVGSFGPVNLNVPALLNLTNSLPFGTLVSRQDSLTLTWTGGNPNDAVVIHGRVFSLPSGTTPPYGDLLRFRSHAFICSTTAGTGRFTIPSYVWSTLPAGPLSINVTHMPSADGVARFNAAGLDIGGVFRWINTTAFLDLVLGP